MYIYIYRGEKGFIPEDVDLVIFNLDAKLVLIYDDTKYPVSCTEFAPYSGAKKNQIRSQQASSGSKKLCIAKLWN